MHAIEEACFAIPWSRESFLREVTENQCARYLVIREDGECVAYAGMWFVLDEAHVCNVAVRPDCRGKGYGKRIFTALIDLAKANSMAMAPAGCCMYTSPQYNTLQQPPIHTSVRKI